MIGATSIGHGNSRVIRSSVGTGARVAPSPGVARLDARAAVEQQGAAAFEHRVGRGRREAGHDPRTTSSVSPSVNRLAGDHAQALHAPAVDERAVRGVEVDELDGLVDLDPRVPLRDERVGEDDVARRRRGRS